MYIKKINLNNFRNYEKQEIILDKGINIFYGDNAQGKTNILEAIFISSFGKSFRTSKEKEMIKLGEDFLETNIAYQKSDRNGKIKIIIGNKKQIEVVSVDGFNLDISPVYEHIEAVKPKNSKKPKNIVIPGEKKKDSND